MNNCRNIIAPVLSNSVVNSFCCRNCSVNKKKLCVSFITIILITSIKNGSQLPLEFIVRLLEQLLRLSHALQISYHSSIHNSIYYHAYNEPILNLTVMVSSTRESSNNQSAHTFIITRAVVLTQIKPTIVLQYEMGLSLKTTEGKMPVSGI